MTPEEVAERYHDRTGFRLIDYREVALPAYAVSTRLLVLSRKRLPVIEEFVLRGVASDLTDPTAIAEFYGLDQRIINGALANLAASDDVALTAADTSRRHVLRLTSKGRTTLGDLLSVVPEERVVQIPFDAILRRIREYPGLPLLAPRETDDAGLLRIPPTKVRKPELADITPEAVEEMLRRLSSDPDAPRDVLSVKGVVRCDRRFVRAVGLLYESDGGGEFQLAFAIDGVLSPEHESAFAAAGGPARLNIAESVSRSKHDRDAGLLQAIKTAAPSVGADTQLRRETAEKKSEIHTLREQLKVTESAERVRELEGRVTELEQSLAAAESRRAQMTSRFLYCYDHAPLLRDAVATASERLLIISPWVKNEVLDDELRDAFVKLLSRGVELYIGWGYPNDDQRPSISARAQRFFDDLSRRFSNAHLKEFGDTHAKVLLLDRSYVVHTSFNWLSFRGDPDRTFRDEQGVLVADPVQVEAKFQELVTRF